MLQKGDLVRRAVAEAATRQIAKHDRIRIAGGDNLPGHRRPQLGPIAEQVLAADAAAQQTWRAAAAGHVGRLRAGIPPQQTQMRQLSTLWFERPQLPAQPFDQRFTGAADVENARQLHAFRISTVALASAVPLTS